MVDLVRTRFPNAYAQAPSKSFGPVMRALGDRQRHGLISELVAGAKVNWAHVGLALLFKSGIVDRVLTTNFDSLAVRACALVDEFPPVHDLPLSPGVLGGSGPPRGIYHLHGQRTALALLDTPEVHAWHLQQAAPLFDVGRDATWIVAGYGGDGDPVFDLLAKVPSFDGGLYWLDRTPMPPHHVENGVLAGDKGTRFIGDVDVDDVFVQLARALGCFPPALLARPFSHLRELVGALTPFPVGAGGGSDFDIAGSCRRWINIAAARFETAPPPEVSLVAGDHDAVIAAHDEIFANAEPRVVTTLARAYMSRGRNTAEAARVLTDRPAADGAFNQAFDDFATSVRIQPDLHETYTFWGVALCDQAQTRQGAAARRLFADGYRMFAMAVKIRPDFHEAYYKWANALSAQAETMPPERIDRVYASAYEKYATAVAIRPDLYAAFNNWGIALTDHGKASGSDRAPGLFHAACEKFAEVVALRPDMGLAYSNWGIALFNHAKCPVDDRLQVKRLYSAAVDRYAMAIKVDPMLADAYFNWGWTLTIQAQGEECEDAHALYAQAYEKFAAAAAIQPGMAENYHNWGWALAAEATGSAGAEADRLYAEACAKYAVALEISPGDFDVLNNWGNALADQAGTKTGEEADRLYAEGYTRFAEAVALNPHLYAPLTNWGGALSAQAKAKAGPERDRLLDLAEEKCARVEELHPGRGTYNLACLAALRSREDKCRFWLDRARASGQLPGRDYLAEDPDLASMRDLEWFDRFLAELDG